MTKPVRLDSSWFHVKDRVFVAFEESLGWVIHRPDAYSLEVLLDSDGQVVSCSPDMLSNVIEPRLNPDGSISLVRAGWGSLA
jgi:hypothetical protein